MSSPDDALKFCLTSPNAVILTLWPSGGKKCVEMAKEYLQSCGAEIRFYEEIQIKKHAATSVVRALYHGEDWLESNCWYNEQPLETGPPSGPHAGAKWKKELCFKSDDANTENYILRTFIVNAKTSSSLWRRKYSTRSEMARKTGNPGNSCMHITDSQETALSKGHVGEGGYACDDSFAFHCARALLDKDSIYFLNTICKDEEIIDKYWDKYTSWLSHSVALPIKFPDEILQNK